MKACVRTAMSKRTVYLYDVAVFAAGRGEVQIAQERQSVFSGSSHFQLVRPADLAVVRPVASCESQGVND